MIFDATQEFTVSYPGPYEDALAFLRDPSRSLRAVRFLRGLTFDGRVVRAELVVTVPMMGEVPVPFESSVIPTPDGAELAPLELSGRAWAEVKGQGVVTGSEAGIDLRYRFAFRVHLDVPRAEKWGGVAFEKMFQQAARRTLERIGRDFPDAVRAAMP